MSSPQSTARSSDSPEPNSERSGRDSAVLMLVGVILVVLAAVLFVYAVTFRPGSVDYHEPGKLVEYVPPSVGPGNSSTTVSTPDYSSVATVKPKQKTRKHRARKGKRKHLVRNHPTKILQQHSEVASGPSANVSLISPLVIRPSNQSPGTRCAQVEEKVGFFKGVTRAIKRLFGLKPEARKANQPPTASLAASTSTITFPCTPDTHSRSGSCLATERGSVQLTTTASDPDGDTMLYSYTVTGGSVTGEGANVSWDLSGVGPGTYTASVEVPDGRGCVTASSTTVTIANCSDCVGSFVCPAVKVSCGEAVDEGQPARFTADFTQGTPTVTPTYNWTVSVGTITSGQGTETITVDTAGTGGQTVSATVKLGGVDPTCGPVASCSVPVRAFQWPDASLTIKIVDPVTRQPLSGVTLIVTGPDGRTLSATSVGVGIFQIPFSGWGNYRVRATRGSMTIEQTVSLVPPPGPSAPALSFSIEFPPSESPSPAPKPSPTSSVAANPSPTATTTATPSPSDKIKKQDQIKATYPSYFEKDLVSNVAFELDRVAREVVTHQTNINGGIESVDRPPRDPHAPIGVPLVSGRGDEYTAHATVRLITTGLTIVEEPTAIEQSLEPEHVAWNFKVKPDAAAREAFFRFHVDIVWKSKVPGRPDHPDKFPFDWPTKVVEIRVPIGPPGYVEGMKYGAAPVGAAGVVALGIGRRRRKRIDSSDEEDEVTTSVFAPIEATPGGSFLVQVFAHIEAQAPFLEEMARASDEDARLRFANQLAKTIKRGARLTFQLIMPGLEIDEEVQHRAWVGKPLPVQFGVTVPRDFEPKDIVGKVIICEESVPIGHLRFKIKIVAGPAASVPANAAVDAGKMSRYHHAFISYASEDRSEVAKRVQAFNLLGLTIFFDFLSIEPGALWEPEIYQHIDQCDVFFLFWSKAASNSEWVHKEIIYALKRKANSEESPPEILPVIIERPPAQPPKELSFLQFNDKFMWFITPDETTGR